MVWSRFKKILFVSYCTFRPCRNHDVRLRSLLGPPVSHFGPRRACMSQTRVAVTALCVVTISTALGIEYIHREQTEEKLRLREGVIRDQELLRRKEAVRGGRDAGEHAPD